jgi:protein-disulfide isomerase-like protein with CxxC motif
MSINGEMMLIEGRESEKRRTLHCVRRALGLSESEFDQYISSMAAEDRAVFDQNLKKYQSTTIYMFGVHPQWSTRLLVEAPELEGDDWSLDQSSLIGAYTADDATPQLSELAEQRKAYLLRLCGDLSPVEAKLFGNMLHVERPAQSFIYDIAGAQLIFKLQGLFLSFCSENEASVREVAPAELESAATLSPFLSRLQIVRLLETFNVVERDVPDSLAAKLMLNVTINRSQLEELEYQRLQKQTNNELMRLLGVLRYQGITKIPFHLDERSYGKWLLARLSMDRAPDGIGQWRPLKLMHLDRFLIRAKAVVMSAGEKHPTSVVGVHPRIAVYVSMLTVAWSYCVKEQHDPRIRLKKEHDLVNGRPLAKEVRSPTTMIHHRRQLAHMLSSIQHYELSADRMAQYHKLNLIKRITYSGFIDEVLRNASLAKWKALSEGIDNYVH